MKKILDFADFASCCKYDVGTYSGGLNADGVYETHGESRCMEQHCQDPRCEEARCPIWNAAEPRKPKVYIAGPLTQGDTNANVAAAIDVFAELLDLGFAPFCPHLTWYADQQAPHDYETWMEYDLEWLKACDAVFVIEGVSPGAEREQRVAWAEGIPVHSDIDALILCGETLFPNQATATARSRSAHRIDETTGPEPPALPCGGPRGG